MTTISTINPVCKNLLITKSSHNCDDTVCTPVMTSPNMKEICEKTEIDTPEKLMLLKSQANKVFQSVKDVCDSNREILASVLGNMCSFT